MSKNLTDTDVFTDPVQAIQNTEPLNEANLSDIGVQHLANRTRFLKTRQDACAQYFVTASAVANGVTLTLAADLVSGSFTLASNQVQVPTAGKYLVIVEFYDMTSSDTANPKELKVQLQAGGALIEAIATRFSATAGHRVSASISFFVNITTPASQKVTLVNTSGTGNMSIGTGGATLNIRRIT
jgi:hypothetical protein